MRFLPTRIHGVMDYALGAMLVILPFAFRFPSNAATWLPVALGVGAVFYSLMTDYELGVFPAIGMRTHLLMDAGSGLLLAASPWLFGFAPIIWMPHLILGLVEVGAALVTRTVPATGAYGARSTRTV